MEKGKVVFLSRENTKGYFFNEETVLISISDIDTKPVETKYEPKDRIDFSFNDVVTPMEQKRFGWREMNVEESTAIAEFIYKHKNVKEIVINCNYGQSRSKALAMAVKMHTFTDRDMYGYNHFGELEQYKQHRADDRDFNAPCYHSLMSSLGMVYRKHFALERKANNDNRTN